VSSIGADEGEQRRLLLAAVRRTDLPLEQLWLRYFGLGGSADLLEVEGYLNELLSLSAVERDVLAQAVNERLDELTWRPRVPYSRPLPEVYPQQGPLAALVDLLEGARGAPPDRLPALVAHAGLALGVDATLYLVDYEQTLLAPVTAAGVPCGAPIGVDTTLPGRAFRDVRVIATDADGEPRLWVPVLDGEERLGVLEARVHDAERLADRSLHEQLRWVASLVGHLVTTTSRFGDGLDLVRRHQPRSPAAELVWSMLPPLTATTGGFALAGLVEPPYAVGSDAFDYALSERVVRLGIFDGMGHALGAGLLTAAALSAYRSARRDGQGLFGQARALDDTLEAQFRGEAFVTGVLAEVDLGSGRLRYVSAGHPEPLLMRGGRVVKTLTEGRRGPFGRGDGELTVAEQALQPGDWLVLHTDGVTGACDASGQPFGHERLVDVLEREAGAAHPPAETVRRVTRAVLEHQDGALRDDATVLLARWDADR